MTQERFFEKLNGFLESPSSLQTKWRNTYKFLLFGAEEGNEVYVEMNGADDEVTCMDEGDKCYLRCYTTEAPDRKLYPLSEIFSAMGMKAYNGSVLDGIILDDWKIKLAVDSPS